MKRAAANLRSAFQSDILMLPLSSIIPQRSANAEVLRSAFSSRFSRLCVRLA